jgi:putative oxidoreductase
MTVVRRLARPMLASMFIVGGLDALRNPKSKVGAAEDVGPAIAAHLPYLPEDTEQLVKINGAAQVGAGLLLALGRFPRLSATVLVGSIVPTTLAGHRFWEIDDDPGRRAQQKIHFFKNLGLLGGLLLAAADTQGKPNLRYRTTHAVDRSQRSVKRAVRTARRDAKIATLSAAAARKLPG